MYTLAGFDLTTNSSSLLGAISSFSAKKLALFEAKNVLANGNFLFFFQLFAEEFGNCSLTLHLQPFENFIRNI
jgi:hypothetical protein